MRVTPGRLVNWSRARSFKRCVSRNDDVHYDVVTACHEKSDADLRHPGDIIHELIDRAALALGQFDHEQRLEPDAERLRIDLGTRLAAPRLPAFA